MRIDEGFGDKVAAGIDLRCGVAVDTIGDRRDAAIADADISQTIAAAAKSAAANDQIERLCHGVLLQRQSTALMRKTLSSGSNRTD